MSQCRNACFTEFDVQKAYVWYQWPEDSDVRYICWGLETCPTTGKQHLQGYIELKEKKTFTGIKKLLNSEKVHLEPRYGTQEQAIEYCKKEGNFYEWGQKKNPGSRTDIRDVRAAAAEGGMRGVLEETVCDDEGVTKPRFGYQACRHAELYLKYCDTGKVCKPEVIWIYGESGTGKSRKANEMCPEAYIKSEGSKWFDGYDGQSDIILDDFRQSWMSMQTLLNILDWVPTRVENKGGVRQLKAKRIVITTIKSPEQHYVEYEDEPQIQLIRRIDRIIELVRKEDTVIKMPTREKIEI